MAGYGTGQGGPPPGWYPDPDRPGNRRWWDGLAWTDFSEPLDASDGGAAPSGGPPPHPTTSGGGYSPGGGGFAAAGTTGPAGASGTAPNIDTWLWQSIVVTVLCCLPLGIVGIVFSSQAQTEISNRNYAVAQQKAKQAKTFTLIGGGIGLLSWLVMFGLFWLPFMFAI